MIHLASKASKNSTYKHKLGAVLVKSGRILATGYNRVGHRSRFAVPIEKEASVHAEIAVISKLMKPKHVHKLQGSKLYISRVRKNGKLGLAKPCSECLSVIKSVGIREIIYTTENGWIRSKV